MNIRNLHRYVWSLWNYGSYFLLISSGGFPISLQNLLPPLVQSYSLWNRKKKSLTVELICNQRCNCSLLCLLHTLRLARVKLLQEGKAGEGVWWDSPAALRQPFCSSWVLHKAARSGLYMKKLKTAMHWQCYPHALSCNGNWRQMVLLFAVSFSVLVHLARFGPFRFLSSLLPFPPDLCVKRQLGSSGRERHAGYNGATKPWGDMQGEECHGVYCPWSLSFRERHCVSHLNSNLVQMKTEEKMNSDMNCFVASMLWDLTDPLETRFLDLFSEHAQKKRFFDPLFRSSVRRGFGVGLRLLKELTWI